MLEIRAMELLKIYNLHRRKIEFICSASTVPIEKLHEVAVLLEKICSTSERLCLEISNSATDADLLPEASNLNRAWIGLRNSVQAALASRTKTAA
jgi:hypothetical protein